MIQNFAHRADNTGFSMTDKYLDMKTYRRLVAALAKAKACPFDGTTDDAIKIALGEIGGLWPTCIRVPVGAKSLKQQ